MASVVVSPYSAEWPHAFLMASEALRNAFAPCPVAIEHVGSTSVPGLAAKPVLDVLIGAASLHDIELRISNLALAGYEYVDKYEGELPDRRYFVKSSALLREHVHAVVLGSVLWSQHLRFRDLLRSDDALRTAYQDLKLDLAARYASDKSAYQAAKDPFIKAALAAEHKPADNKKPALP